MRERAGELSVRPRRRRDARAGVGAVTVKPELETVVVLALIRRERVDEIRAFVWVGLQIVKLVHAVAEADELVPIVAQRAAGGAGRSDARAE